MQQYTISLWRCCANQIWVCVELELVVLFTGPPNQFLKLPCDANYNLFFLSLPVSDLSLKTPPFSALAQSAFQKVYLKTHNPL